MVSTQRAKHDIAPNLLTLLNYDTKSIGNKLLILYTTILLLNDLQIILK